MKQFAKAKKAGKGSGKPSFPAINEENTGPWRNSNKSTLGAVGEDAPDETDMDEAGENDGIEEMEEEGQTAAHAHERLDGMEQRLSALESKHAHPNGANPNHQTMPGPGAVGKKEMNAAAHGKVAPKSPKLSGRQSAFLGY